MSRPLTPGPSNRPRPGSLWCRVRTAAACTLAAAGLVLSAAQAQDKPAGGAAGGGTTVQPGNAGAKPPAPVILIDKPGLDKLLVDPKDEAFKKALAMLPSRLRELPREIPGAEQVPMPVVDLALQLITRPARFAVTYSPDNPSKGGFGAGIVFSLAMDDEQGATTMHGTINGLMAMAGGGGGGGGGGGMQSLIKPSATYNGMSELQTPVGLLAYGPRKSDDAGWRYEVHFGSLEHPDKPFAGWAKTTDLVKGFEPVLRARFDPAPLTPLVNMAKAFAGGGPVVDDAVKRVEDVGLIGDNAIKYSYYQGYTSDRAVTVTIAEGAKKFAARKGASVEPLTAAELKAIPADAVTAAMMRYDWKTAANDGLDEILEADPSAKAQLAQLEGRLGLSLKNDILPAFGSTFGGYLAPSAGGHGLGSAVGLVAIGDKAKFDALNTRLIGMLNVLGAAPQVKGYIRARQWTHDGLALTSLTFPGVPVPIELTYAVTDKWLVLGLTPQAALAGVAQAAGKGDGGITTSAALASVLPKDKQVLSLTFVDSAKTMADGYQYLSLIGSALANAVRSPADPAREPGMVIPPYKALAEGAKPIVSYSYLRGEDIISEAQADRSMLVNGAATIGAASPAFPLIAAFIAGMGIAAQNHPPHIPGVSAAWPALTPNDAAWHEQHSASAPAAARDDSELVYAR
jgi:hypothetical protein